MSESENSWYTERGEMEVQSTIAIPDDHCNHLNCILWDMRQRADLRKKFTPRPKPEYHPQSFTGCKSAPKQMNIGVRKSYCLHIVRGIYQLHRLGQSDHKIGKSLGIPEEEIYKIIHQRNSTAEREWRRVNSEPSIPKPLEILRSIEKEVRYVYGNDAAGV